MSKFVASNGAEITVADYGTFKTLLSKTVDNSVALAGVHVDALREFFTHEANKRPWHDAQRGDVWLFHNETDKQRALGWMAADSWDAIDPRGNFHSAISDIPEAMREQGFYGWETPTAELIYRSVKEES